MKEGGSKEAEYFSKDFDWEELKQEIQNNPSFRYHLEEDEEQYPSRPTSSSSLHPPPAAAAAAAAAAKSNPWSKFHARHHTGKFFKERRYLLKEFPELVNCAKGSKVLEVGCGNGSTILPILRGNENVIVYACDCSPEALKYAKEVVDQTNIESIKDRFHPFHCDFALSGFPTWFTCSSSCKDTLLSNSGVSDATGQQHQNDFTLSKESSCCLGGVNFITLIFTLSAIPYRTMISALKECFSVLKPGGLVLFRDYGLFDMTMLRFEPDKRVGFREYMRSDGTLSYFFSIETTRDLFLQAGFVEVELEYCCIKSLNRKKEKSMRRVWVHGKFQKPL